MIRLQSKVHGDILLLDVVASAVLRLLGKDTQADQGIIPVEMLPDAIARLERAALPPESTRTSRPQPSDPEDAEPEAVTLHQRLQPVLALLRHCQREGVPVIWRRD